MGQEALICWLASYPRSGNDYFGLVSISMGVERQSRYKLSLAKLRRLNDSEGLHLVKTHELPVDQNPAIYLIRDGRDSLVSFAHHTLKHDLPHSTFLKVLEAHLQGHPHFGTWGQNVAAWTNRSAPTVIVHFHELIADPESVVRSTLQKAGFRPGRAREIPTFSKLQKLKPNLFRRGQIGSWKDELPPHLEEQFWSAHASIMQKLGYVR